MADIRLRKIYEAASRLFINRGYAQTQINHIAKAAGISVGAVYTMFTSKKAILDFILKVVIAPDFLERDQELPMGEDVFIGLDTEIINAFEENYSRFSARLDGMERYPLGEMLSDAFDVIARYGTGCLLLEKNPDACGEWFQYYVDYRQRFFERFLRYMEFYQKRGEVRKLEYPQHSTTLMIETLSWWAMHISQDAFQVQDVPVETAKTVCLDALIHAYEA